MYMPFARTVDYNIELQIPDGYTAEGIQALNTSVQNEAASFMVKTSILGDKLLIKVVNYVVIVKGYNISSYLVLNLP